MEKPVTSSGWRQIRELVPRAKRKVFDAKFYPSRHGQTTARLNSRLQATSVCHGVMHFHDEASIVLCHIQRLQWNADGIGRRNRDLNRGAHQVAACRNQLLTTLRIHRVVRDFQVLDNACRGSAIHIGF